MEHENDQPQPSKVIERYYKICIIEKLSYWMGYMIACHQDNTHKS